MKLTVLLPMKGHSERVPNKNIRPFAGKPLFHIIMQKLQHSDLIRSIIVNTDSEDIAKDAEANFSKVKIHMRPEKIQGDNVPTNEIIAHDISLVDSEHYLQTHCTNPLLTQKTFEKAIRYYFKNLNEFDSVFSVSKWQTRLFWESGEPINHNPKELLRTQDLPPIFEENSNFYIFSKKSFTAAGNSRIGLRPKMLTIDKLEAVDIDEEADFKLAEYLYKIKYIEE